MPHSLMVSKRKRHQTQAKAVFQAQTATGKLKAEMIPTVPIG
jgi:hypothetical protein